MSHITDKQKRLVLSVVVVLLVLLSVYIRYNNYNKNRTAIENFAINNYFSQNKRNKRRVELSLLEEKLTRLEGELRATEIDIRQANQSLHSTTIYHRRKIGDKITLLNKKLNDLIGEIDTTKTTIYNL